MNGHPRPAPKPCIDPLPSLPSLIGATIGGYCENDDKLPFTIEIIEFKDESPAVLDRVIGGSVYFEEAKRIDQHLLWRR